MDEARFPEADVIVSVLALMSALGYFSGKSVASVSALGNLWESMHENPQGPERKGRGCDASDVNKNS